MGETLVELLQERATSLGERGHVCLVDDEEREHWLSFAALRQAAERTAAGLQERGVAVGDRVLVMLPTGAPLLAALYGCHLAGAIPVPLYPPFQLKGVAAYLERLGRIVEAVEARLMVVDPALKTLARGSLGRRCPALVTPAEVDSHAAYRPVEIMTDHPALIQFSSGSTGPQKGVVLTHRQLVANCRAIAERLGLQTGMRGVSWLPLYHDMGLIGGLFIPLLVGMEAVLFSPKAFLLDPARWLRLLSKHKAVIAIGPNFGLELLTRRVKPEQIAGIDLSPLRIVLNGAEPIDPDTVRRFEERFAPWGLRSAVTLGVYGLAEAALGVSMPPAGHGLVVDTIDTGETTREVAAVGQPLPGYEVEIRDAEGRAVGERVEGAIAVRGPSLMQGYWGQPAETARALQDGWLITGDLGYMAGGTLYVTGRSKDLIIRGGRNYHPQELERAAESVEGVRGGSAVAFGVPDRERGTEAVVVAFETRRPAAEHAELLKQVAAAVHAATGLRPEKGLALLPGSVPKTSSGKRQRQQARALYLDGRLGEAASSLDALRLVAGNHLPAWLRRAGGQA